MDLQRAAVNLYKDPKGDVWKRFLEHALETLRLLEKDAMSRKIYNQLLIEDTNVEFQKSRRVADKLLTFGLMLKPSFCA